MRTEIKIIIGVIGSVLLYLIYFATEVSAFYPPIKFYGFALTKDELRRQLTNVVYSIPHSTIQLTDSTGSKRDTSYHCELTVRIGPDEFEYFIIYKQENSFSDKSKLELIGAFDRNKGTGGYKIEDPDVKGLIVIFEKTIIDKLPVKKTDR